MHGCVGNRFKNSTLVSIVPFKKLSSKMSEYIVPKTFNGRLLLSFAKAYIKSLIYFDQSSAELSMTKNSIKKGDLYQIF